MSITKYFFFIIFNLICYNFLFAQSTAVMFLLKETNARAAGMGGSFTAVANDASSMYYNPAGLSQVEYGSFEYNYYEYYPSYFDWSILNISGSYRIPKIGVMGIQLNYFSLGKYILVNETGTEIGTYEPTEWTLSIGYSKPLNSFTSLGLSFKYIKSDNRYVNVDNYGLKESNGYAFDFGILINNIFQDICYYKRTNDLKYQKYLLNRPAKGPSIGVTIKNIGPEYELSKKYKEALPQQLRIGLAWNFFDTDYLNILFASDVRKLLVKRNPDGKYDSFYNAWFSSWEKFSFNKFEFSAGLELNFLYFVSFRLGRYIDDINWAVYKYWVYGISLGPETFRLNAYKQNFDSELYSRDDAWRFGLSIAY